MAAPDRTLDAVPTVPTVPTVPLPSLTGWARGLAVATVGATVAMLAHAWIGQIGSLTWAVLLGVVATNLRLLPRDLRPQLRLVTTRVLRIGIVLLGFSLPLSAIVGLGAPVIGLVVATLLTTLLSTHWLGRRIGIGRPRSLLLATGVAICGASAIAAMEENAGADDEDVTVAIAMVTLWGTATMIALPLLQSPLGLSDTQLGVWAGASVHEVGQVVAAAGPAGTAAVAVAVVVKLTRVLLLAPVVAVVGVARRRDTSYDGVSTPPVVPVFVLGFLGCVVLRSIGWVPPDALDVIATVQNVTLAAALFGMGSGVDLRSLVRTSGSAFGLSAVATVIVAVVSLCGVLLIG